MDYKDILEIVTFFRNIDYNFVLAFLTFLATIIAIIFAVISFRPKIHLEISNVLMENDMSSYDLVLINNGNVLAQDIQLFYDKKSLQKALNPDFTPPPEIEEIYRVNFIKEALSKKVKYLGAGKTKNGTFVIQEKGKETSPIKFNVPFFVKVTYKNSITKLKYIDNITLELVSDSSLTGYSMNDKMGHYLKNVNEKLDNINLKLHHSTMRLNINNGIYDGEKTLNAKKVFLSLNKKEKIEIMNMFASCYCPLVKQTDPNLFDDKIKKYLTKTNSLSKKLQKLHYDGFNDFFNIVLHYNENHII